MTKKHQSMATWIIGLLFFGVLCLVIFTDLVRTEDQVKRKVVFLFCSLMGGLFAGFFTGQMTVHTDWTVPVKVKFALGQITVPQQKTEKVAIPVTTTNIVHELIPNRVLTITPEAEPLKSYVTVRVDQLNK